MIRDATEADAAACAAIYASYVTETAISFEVVPPSVDEMAVRIARYAPTHAWLVLERDGVVGYACARAFAERPAYRWSCETTVYVDRGAHRGGVGRALYDALLGRVAARGYLRAFAGITLPNDGSVCLHRAFGFEPCGVYRRVGYKFGRWHDVAWFQRDLGPDDDPAEPR